MPSGPQVLVLSELFTEQTTFAKRHQQQSTMPKGDVGGSSWRLFELVLFGI
jgi:hypothetical protein